MRKIRRRYLTFRQTPRFYVAHDSGYHQKPARSAFLLYHGIESFSVGWRGTVPTIDPALPSDTDDIKNDEIHV